MAIMYGYSGSLLMTKRIAVVGAGTAGAISAAFFSYPNHFKEKYEVHWYADSSIPTQAVGEGSNLIVPKQLLSVMGFNYNDLDEVDGTFKSGIAKYNWGNQNSYYFHDFAPPSVGYHFNAVKLQQYIGKRLGSNVTRIDQNVVASEVDADFIIDCTGKPKSLEDFYEVKVIPVNSVHVTQCFWEYPKFQHTLTIARPYGWVFGIPLKNRCAIGYMYNNKINTMEEVKEDVKNVFEEFGLTPSDTTNSFSFQSYFRKQNYTDRMAYNGNASFFSEPLEATTIGNMMLINRQVMNMLNKFDNTTVQKACRNYLIMNQGCVDMICLHYFAGSKFKTEFWEHAKQLAISQLARAANNPAFKNLCLEAIKQIKLNTPYNEIFKINKGEYGTWAIGSYVTNIRGLGIASQLEQLFNR